MERTQGSRTKNDKSHREPYMVPRLAYDAPSREDYCWQSANRQNLSVFLIPGETVRHHGIAARCTNADYNALYLGRKVASRHGRPCAETRPPVCVLQRPEKRQS